MSQDYRIVSLTDPGLMREVNEDSMVAFDSPCGRVAAVCDGMGGYAAGEVASSLACAIIRDILENNTFATPEEAITRAIMAANQGILHRASVEPGLEGMGATCVLTIFVGGLLYYGWVGDSRIYYFSDGILTQISRDQSLVQTLVDAGRISPEEALDHPQKNEITNALGTPDMTPPLLCSEPLRAASGSIVMLCSDGLSGMLSDSAMSMILDAPNLSLEQKAEKLVAGANAAGGDDNISLQLIGFGTAPRKALKNRSKTRKNALTTAGLDTMTLIIVGIVLALLILAGVIGLGFGKKLFKKNEEKVDDSVELTEDSKFFTDANVLLEQAQLKIQNYD